MKKTVTLLLLAGAFLGALVLPFANIGQTPGPPNLDRVLFVPTKYPTGQWEPSDLDYKDVFFRSADNTLLHGWYCPSVDADLTILIVHGNAGNVSTRIGLLQHLQNIVMANVFIFDYRGYGRSEGIPTVDGILMDARAARSKLEELAKTPASEFVIIGESIGGAVAVDLAASESPRGLILQSTFSNLKDLARIHYPQFVPSVPNDVLNSIRMIPKYRGPLLQSHGKYDRIIPIALGRRLFEMAMGEKHFFPIPEAGHNDWQTPAYFVQLDRFLEQLVKPAHE